MAAPNSMCPICSSPIVLGAYRILEEGEMVHVKCGAPFRLANRWPEGIRHVLCLGCGRSLESESKAQRICKPCRSRAWSAS